ncbi:MAG: DUF1549 domain-containing protein [Planctomycetaceae bacterium]|jgi:hypothetical protein|nr:DUF1549 domain-containing protein [Planctomycetaceae bacterium]MBT6485922.1 DUF1549 domain-containing protein [Planctomycetaceae bacterium]MBT6497181.1 DUF1549 domain-containing protein [Planctomycetaceae bacterium]
MITRRSWIMLFTVVAALGFVSTSAFLSADEENAQSTDAKLPPPADGKVDFVRDIQPLFVKRCLECHGPEMQEAGFRLDRKKDAFVGGDKGPAFVAGKSATSLLVKYVAGIDPDLIMPPDGDPLTKKQIGLVRAWIDQGANWPKDADLTAPGSENTHWSYQPIVRPDVPKPDGAAWVKNPIDAFVLDRLNGRGIKPSPETDRYTLIRRLSLDLLGLPPTPEDVDEFVADKSPDAYENLVDRMLQSPHFGERWGRHWLDKARYADSDGYEKDRPRPNAWRWRDWVIDAVNRDMPFDQFTVEQLAGDLLPDASESQKLATAFHRQTLTNTEGGTDQEQFRVEAVFDRVETTGTVWLGLTVGCSRCHSHKYDPIPQREFYQLFAFFNNGDETNTNVRISDEAVERFNKNKATHDVAVKELQQSLEAARTKLAPGLAKWIESQIGKTTGWTVAEAAELKSAGGATFTKQKDGSYLLGGKNPASDTYTVTLRTKLNHISGIRLETLPDKSLPASGPGRVKHGNFVLSEVSVTARPNGQEKHAPVELTRAAADFEQPGSGGKPSWTAAATLDGKADTGWAISPQFGKLHTIVFETKENVGIENGETELVITLSHQYGSQHTIGRLRISLTSDQRPVNIDGLPKNIADILAVAADKRDAKQQRELLVYFTDRDAAVQQLKKQLAALTKKAPKSPYMAVRVIAQRSANPRKTHIFRRGEFLQPTVEVQPDILEILHPFKPRKQETVPDRLDLARWLMSPENPLTPRVAVNHVWEHLFGRSLVPTMNDFGSRGDKSTHPKLLDWLASEYIRLGWSRKALIKTVVMSATYRQSSAHRPELADIDPQNRLLYRQNRPRVEAEIIRDLSLSAGGLLSRKIGGPSVFPPLPPDIAALSYANSFRWTTSKGEDRYRRGMYTFFKRTAPHPNLTTFDCPDGNTTSIDRQSSNTPLQALVTMNNEVFIEASQAMARRLLKVKLKDDNARLAYGIRICVARQPTKQEQSQFAGLLSAAKTWYGEHNDDAIKLVGSYAVDGVSPADNAAWVATARVMLNMDEFFTRE